MTCVRGDDRQPDSMFSYVSASPDCQFAPPPNPGATIVSAMTRTARGDPTRDIRAHVIHCQRRAAGIGGRRIDCYCVGTCDSDETTPQTVDCTYDAADRRASMTRRRDSLISWGVRSLSRIR